MHLSKEATMLAQLSCLLQRLSVGARTSVLPAQLGQCPVSCTEYSSCWTTWTTAGNHANKSHIHVRTHTHTHSHMCAHIYKLQPSSFLSLFLRITQKSIVLSFHIYTYVCVCCCSFQTLTNTGISMGYWWKKHTPSQPPAEEPESLALAVKMSPFLKGTSSLPHWLDTFSEAPPCYLWY